MHILATHTHEVSGPRGVKRVVLGLCLMVLAALYFSFVTMDSIFSTSDWITFHAESVRNQIVGGEPMSKVDYILKK